MSEAERTGGEQPGWRKSTGLLVRILVPLVQSRLPPRCIRAAQVTGASRVPPGGNPGTPSGGRCGLTVGRKSFASRTSAPSTPSRKVRFLDLDEILCGGVTSILPEIREFFRTSRRRFQPGHKVQRSPSGLSDSVSETRFEGIVHDVKWSRPHQGGDLVGIFSTHRELSCWGYST